MKPSLPFSIILAFVLFSCEEKVKEGSTAFLYYENSQISNDYPWVTTGNSLVFHRYYRADDVLEIADDEYSEDFMFAVPESESFNFENDELVNLKFLFKRYCYCYPTDSTVITGGRISGTKRGDRWKVSVDITLKEGYINESDSLVLSDEFVKSFEGEFKKSSYNPD